MSFPSSTYSSSNYKTHSFPPSQTAWDLLQQNFQQQRPTKLLEGCNADFLSLHPGVYELAGPAGSGKTQVALHLCLREAAAAGETIDSSLMTRGEILNPTAVDCSTESTIHSRRQRTQPNHTTSNIYRAVYFSLGGTIRRDKILQRLSQMASGNNEILGRIATRCVYNQDDWLNDVLNVQLPQLLEQQQQQQQLESQQQWPEKPQQRQGNNIRVVVVDALADLFRCVLSTSVSDRAAKLCYIAQRLKQMADQHQLTVLVLNQVTGNDHLPALGLVWAHCCNASFSTSVSETAIIATSKAAPVVDQSQDKENNTHKDPAQDQQNQHYQRRRTLTLRHSSRYGGSRLQVGFFIDRSGVHAMADTA
ncbi:hypothetical protein ACA910_015150 [Epithemia clementina (nom. ined.)]